MKNKQKRKLYLKVITLVMNMKINNNKGGNYE